MITDKTKAHSQLAWLAKILLLMSLVAVLIESLRWFFFVPAALISFELIISFILIVLGYPRLFTLIFCALVIIHAFFAAAPAYHLNLNSISYWLVSLLGLPITFKIALLVCLLILCIFIYIVASNLEKTQPSKSFAFLIILSLASSCVLVDRVLEPQIGRNLIDSDTWSIIKVARRPISESSEAISEPIDSASEALFQKLEKNEKLPKKILFVMIESFGFGTSEINQYQYKEMISKELVARGREVTFSSVPFKGSTIPGEYRELCRAYTNTPILNIPQQIQGSCLPRILAEQHGFETQALHGYGGGFFDRVRLYREFGFDKTLFGTELQSRIPLQKKCGHLLFKGLCDAEVADHIEKSLSSLNGQQFLYWLTLNGHQPSHSSPQLGQFLTCEKMNLDVDSICWTIQYAQVVTNSVINIAKSHPDVYIILVGDHSPGTHRGVFSASRVPMIIIEPSEE